MSIFRIDSLFISYAKKVVLSGVNFQLDGPGVYYLAGPNGSGKTSFFDAVYGRNRATREFVSVDDAFVDRRRRYREIGYMPQKSFLPLDLKVEVLLKKILDNRQLTSALNKPTILDYRKRVIGDLSTGERRYLEATIILQGNKRVVLLDEPFTNVDPLEASLLGQDIRLAGTSKCIIMSGHTHQTCRQFSDRLLVIHNRNIREVQNSKDVLQHFGYVK